MPSSNTLSESSSGRLPASSALTICSRRARQSSNLRSVITLPGRVDATVEASFVEENVHAGAAAHVAPGPHDAAVCGPRQAVSASEHRQRREGVQAPGAGAEAMARAVHVAIHPALQAALQIDQRAPAVE